MLSWRSLEASLEGRSPVYVTGFSSSTLIFLKLLYGNLLRVVPTDKHPIIADVRYYVSLVSRIEPVIPWSETANTCEAQYYTVV